MNRPPTIRDLLATDEVRNGVCEGGKFLVEKVFLKHEGGKSENEGEAENNKETVEESHATMLVSGATT